MNERALTCAPGTSSPGAGEPSRLSLKDIVLRRLWGSERGTAVVEFALVAPVLFLLVFGIVDFGRALNYYNDLTQLAGQGARAAVVNRNPDGTAVTASGTLAPTCDGRTDSIQCLLVAYYTSTAELKNGISVCLGTMNSGGTITNAVPSAGQPVTVRATYTFNFIPLVHAATIRLVATQTELSETIAPTYTAGAVKGPGGTAGGDACSP